MENLLKILHIKIGEPFFFIEFSPFLGLLSLNQFFSSQADGINSNIPSILSTIFSYFFQFPFPVINFSAGLKCPYLTRQKTRSLLLSGKKILKRLEENPDFFSYFHKSLFLLWLQMKTFFHCFPYCLCVHRPIPLSII